MDKSRCSRPGTILPSVCGSMAAPVVPQSAVSDFIRTSWKATWAPGCLFLQNCRDMLGLGTEISFNARGHNRESTNAMSFEERGWRRSQALHSSERSCAAERLKEHVSNCCMIPEALHTVSVQCRGRQDTPEVTSASDVWGCLIFQPILLNDG